MAVFNPQIQPTQDFSTQWGSRPVDTVGVDTSAGGLLKGLGDALTGGVQVVDTAIKRGIQDSVYAQVDPRRDEMTAALEKIKTQTRSVTPAPAATAAGPVADANGTTTTGKTWLDANALADEEPEVPEGIEQGLDKVKLLTAARSAAKINDTQYSGEVLTIAKSLRAQYGPGYRDYVDQQISQASGLPVANAYYQNLMTDINRQLSSVGKTKDGVDALVLKNLNVPDIQTYWAKYKAGDPSVPESMIIDKIAQFQQRESKFKTDAAVRSESDANKKDKADDAMKSFTTYATDTVTDKLSSVVDLSGIKSKTADLVNYFSDVSSGRLQQSEAQVLQRKAQLDAIVDETRRGMLAKAAEGGPNSVITHNGQKAVNDAIDQALYPLTATAKFAGNKEDGPAFYIARQNEAIKNGAVNNFLINKDTYAATQQLYGARTVIGDAYLPSWISNMVATNVDNKYKSMFEQEGLSAISPIVDERGTPVPRSMKQAIEHAKDVNVPESSGVYGAYTSKIPSWITDPNLNQNTKDRVIDWTFNPEKNRGVLSHIKNDYKDPQTNTEVPGKHAALNDLTSPAMVDSIAETAKNKPENWSKFITTVQGEFQTIARSDIQDINKILDKPYLKIGYAWDEKNNRLSLVDAQNRPLVKNDRLPATQYPDQAYVNNALDVVDRLNGNIARVAYAHQKNPDGAVDTTKFMYDTFRDMRANRAILGAIVKSRNPDVFTPEPAAIPFAQENKGQSVASFVSNPTNEPLPKAPRGQVVGPNETITNVKSDEIPPGMSVRDFIKQLKREGKY